MESVREALPVIIVELVILVLLLGYMYGSGSRITGFGPHVVKKTETLEYDYGQGQQPTRRSIATETQTGRTFWDWMTVLTISAAIGAAALLFSYRQAEQQQAIQDQQAKDATLQAYLDQMTQMMLDSKVPVQKWKPDSEEGIAVRALTVTALKSLDGEHNKSVMTFLTESGLVDFGLPGDKEVGALRLDQADLKGVNLADNTLSGFNLRFAQLRETDLHDANLSVANLTFAGLRDADLRDADLLDADLLFANLADANLKGANLTDANLSGADLSGADLDNDALTKKQKNQAGAGSAGNAVKLPWTVPVHRLQASVVPLKSLTLENIGKIGIPEKVDTEKVDTSRGALVYYVKPGGLAEAAGFKPGDIIVSVNFKGVRGVEHLQQRLGQYKAGKRVLFDTLRSYFQDWKRGTLDAKLGG
jgi:hypothetical protein